MRILQRQREGIALAGQQGKYRGRQPLPFDEKQFRREVRVFIQSRVVTVLLPHRFYALDFLGNFRSAVLLVSFALCFAPLPCNTPSIAAVESLCTGQNILRIPSLRQIPRKSILKVRPAYSLEHKKAPPQRMRGGAFRSYHVS